MSLVREGPSFEVEGGGGNWTKTTPSGEPQESFRACAQFYSQTFMDLYIVFSGWSRLQEELNGGQDMEA